MCSQFQVQLPLHIVEAAFSHTRFPLRFPAGRPKIEPREIVTIGDATAVVLAGEEGPELNTLLFAFWEGELGHLKARLKQEGATLSREELVALTARYEEVAEYCVQLKHKRSNLLTTTKNSPDEL